MAMKAERSNFGYTIADMTRLLRRVFDRRAAQLGLTRAQWRALKLWSKDLANNVADAQKTVFARARDNGLASLGQWKKAG